jgi:hypothetical protein
VTDPHNDKVDPRFELEEELEEQQALTEYYQDGIKFFYQQGYKLVPHIQGQFGFHKVYRLTGPGRLKGLTIEPEFRIWHEVASEGAVSLFQSTARAYIEANEKEGKFWLPLIKPDAAKRQPLYAHARSLISLSKLNEDQHSGEPINVGIDPFPILPASLDVAHETAPRAWIPDATWFKESVRQLKVEDIITLFPPAELELLKLIIGRAVVGFSGHQTPSGVVIRHTSRMAALVLGEDPGLGKSTIFNYLWDALKWVGYSVNTFSDIGARFNMGEVATADIIYKDDITSKGLKKFISSENTKIIITGNGLLRVEDKGIDATNVRPIGTIFLNTNEFDPRSVYEIDPGTADRLKILSTYRKPELEQLQTNTSSAYPEVHIPELAKKLKVDQRVLMLWVARLCADQFYQLICKPGPENHLKTSVHFWTHKLRKPLYKNSASQIMSFFVYIGMLHGSQNKPAERKAKQKSLEYNRPVDRVLWKEILPKAEKFLFTSQPWYYQLFLKWHFETFDPTNEFHPWLGMELVHKASLRAASAAASMIVDDSASYLAVSKVFEQLRLGDGLPCSKDFTWLNLSYSHIIPHYYDIYKLAELAIEVVEKVIEKDGLSVTLDPDNNCDERRPVATMAKLQYTDELVNKFQIAYEELL